MSPVLFAIGAAGEIRIDLHGKYWADRLACLCMRCVYTLHRYESIYIYEYRVYIIYIVYTCIWT